MNTAKFVLGTIVLVCWALDLLVNAANHGEDKKPQEYNFWATLIGKIIDFIILAIGGFWFFM